MTLQRFEVDGYEALKKCVGEAKGKVFVLYSGGKVDGKSWCPDCVRAEPVIDQVLEKNAEELKDVTFITCLVGQKEYWRNPECPFRVDPAIKINCIPTLVEWGSKAKRLGDDQCSNEHLVKDLLLDD